VFSTKKERDTPMKQQEYENYLNFIDEALEMAKAIPRYFSRFSNKIYCNHQKLAIYILMQKFKKTYRGIVSWLKSNSDARLHLGLYKIPVHTTMVRFAKKISGYANLFFSIKQAKTVALDATGFELEAKSFYYRNLWNSDQMQKTRQYMKLSIVADVNKQLILKCKIRKKLRNDIIDFKSLLKGLNVSYVVADKGYDSSANRTFVIRKLKAIPVIPVRNHTNFYGYFPLGRKISGRRYHQRSKVESIFSAIKRKYGSVLRARSFATQKVELISKVIAYNLDRKLNYLSLLIRGLHQSPIVYCNQKGCSYKRKN